MSEFDGQVGARIRSFVERVEQIEAEVKELNEAKKEIFAEANGNGFEIKMAQSKAA